MLDLSYSTITLSDSVGGLTYISETRSVDDGRLAQRFMARVSEDLHCDGSQV